MGYKTFVSNTTATLSIAAVVSLGYSLDDTSSSNYHSLYITNNSFIGSTYNGVGKIQEKNSVELEELNTVIEFANKLLSNSKPLDADIAKIVDDNLMDLLA